MVAPRKNPCRGVLLLPKFKIQSAPLSGDNNVITGRIRSVNTLRIFFCKNR